MYSTVGASVVSYCANPYCVMVHLNTNIFLFLLSVTNFIQLVSSQPVD